MKKTVALILSIMLALSITIPASAFITYKVDPSKLKPVELVYYFANSPQSDIESAQKYLSELTTKKINATVKLNLIDWNSYDTKMNVVVASGEDYDLCWTAANNNPFYQNVAKGAFAPLNDLLDIYAPKTRANLPGTYWKVATVKGKIYSVPVFQQSTAGYGYLIQQSIADKNKIDWKSVKKLSDLTPILEKVKKSNPALVTFGIVRDGLFSRYSLLHGMEPLGDSYSPGWIYIKDKNMKVVNQYESPEFKSYLKLIRDWYVKGYLRKDVSSLKEIDADNKAAKNALRFGQIDIDTLDYQKVGIAYNGRMFAAGNVKSYDLKFVDPLLTTDKAAATMTAVSATSNNKERAVMLIELLNNDVETVNAINWGVEGKHYKKLDNKRIEIIKTGGYDHESNWEFGNLENSYDPWGYKSEAEAIKANKLWVDLNKNAKGSNALGFVFDAKPVKTEIAACQAVYDELYPSLATGSVDPDKYLPQFISKLKKAGADKIIAEKQRQMNVWKAGK